MQVFLTPEEKIIEQLRTENAALKEQVAQWETEYNGCSTLLNNAERTIETLEETIAQQAEAIRLKDAALEKIACIGNGDSHGNSIGNCLAIDALAIQPSPEILQARDELVAEACAKAVIAYNGGQCDAHVLASQLICGEWSKHI